MKNILFVALTFLASGSLAQAGPILTSFVDPLLGNVHLSGGSIVGTNLGVGSMLGQNTPLQNNTTTQLFNSVGPHGALLGDARFSFSTGSLLSEHTFGHLEVFTFAKGGSFSLVGGANLDQLPKFHAGDIPAGTTLFSGQFSSKEFLIYNTQTGVATLIGKTHETLNPALASFYGVPTDFRGFVDLSFGVTHNGKDIYSLGGVVEAIHAVPIQPVPEPAFLTLAMSGGLFTGVVSLRRRRRASGVPGGQDTTPPSR